MSQSTQKSHFGDVPHANLLIWYGKTKPNTTKARIHQYNTKKIKPGLVAFYNIGLETVKAYSYFGAS